MQQIFFPLLLFIWAGMLLGISFLEAWVKFKAPSLTKEVGLDVGRTVFRAFQKVQWCLWGAIFLAMLVYSLSLAYFIIPLSLGVLLSLQTFWLFPQLSARAELIILKQEPKKSYHHAFYTITEIIKLLLLLGSGICLMGIHHL